MNHDAKPEASNLQCLSLSQLRRAARAMQTLGVHGEIKVTLHADCEAGARDLPGFTPVVQYQTVEWLCRKLMLGEDLANTKAQYLDEIGLCERFRLVSVINQSLRRADDVYEVILEAGDRRMSLQVLAPVLS